MAEENVDEFAIPDNLPMLPLMYQHLLSFTQNPSLEEWHSHGENVSREMFSQADFIIGNSAACYDLVNRIVYAFASTLFLPDWLPA